MPSSNLFGTAASHDVIRANPSPCFVADGGTEATYGRSYMDGHVAETIRSRVSNDSWSSRSYYVSDNTDNDTYGRVIVDDVEYRTVDSVWDQPTRTVTAEDIRRAHRSLDSGAHIYKAPISLEALYQNLYSPEAAFRSCGVSAQPTRPRITFGEL